MDAAIDKVRSGFLPIPNNDALWLAEIADGHQRPAPERIGLLSLGWFSSTHLTVCDRNGEEWYDVHPLVATHVRAQAERAGQRLMKTTSALIERFAEKIASRAIDIYNEFSLQHELGIFLRDQLPRYRVQFERNVSWFGLQKQRFTKREIDLTVFSPDKSRLLKALELKYPRNGQYPEQMFSMCKDIAFLEELVASGFEEAAFVVFADDRLFYEGSDDGIYGYFRTGRELHGKVEKPTGKKDAEISIRGRYRVRWQPVTGDLRYAIVVVDGA